MRRICFLFCLASALICSWASRGQDAATEERLNRLAGDIEGLIVAHKGLQKQIQELSAQVESLREQMQRPNTSYLTSEDIKPIVESIREVDRKRLADAEKIQEQLKAIQRIAASAPPPPRTTKPPVADKPEKGFEYEIQPGDTLSTIAAAYRQQNVKVTTDQILKANPGLKPERLQVGQIIFIPKP